MKPSVLLYLFGMPLLACSSSGGDDGGIGNAGAAGTSSTGGTGGVVSSGGTGGASTGGASTGGASTGGASTGGASTGGAGGASTGGSSSGGTGGSSASGGSAGVGGSGASAGAAGSAGAGGSTSCDCVAPPPPAWTGPVLLAEVGPTGSLPGCPTDLPTQQTFNRTLTVPATSCDCECSTPSVFCGAFRIRESGSLCPAGGTSAGLLAQGECITMSASGIFRLDAPNPVLGMCTAMPTVDTPAPTWQSTAVACGGATNTCATGVCVPQSGSFDRLCIHRNGDEACPAGGYTERSVFYGGFDDTRGCSTCTCGTATGSCSGRVDLKTGSCTGTIVDSAASGACTSGSVSPTHAVLASFASSGSCQESTVTATGTVAERDPVTFCCEP